VAARGQEAAADERAESLVKELRSEELESRRHAALAIRQSDREVWLRALPALIDRLMNEKDGQVRLAVLDTVYVLGPDAAPAIDALAHTLRTDYGGQRREESHQDYRSALALAAIGKPAVKTLRGLLSEEKEHVRAEVVMGLGRIGPDASAAVPELIGLLEDKTERIQNEAMLALSGIGTGAVEPLIAAVACDESSTTVRARAIESLGLIPEPVAVARDVLLAGTRDAEPKVRAAAIRGLRRLDLPRAEYLLICSENLRHPNEEVRLAVIGGLSEHQSELLELAAELGTLLRSEDEGVARHAAFLLGKLGPRAAPTLLEALEDERGRIDSIAQVLAGFGRPVVGALEHALDSSNSRVRRGAALALGQLRPMAPGTVDRLTVGLRDGDGEVRSTFLAAIGHLGPSASASVTAVRGLLHDDSPEIRLRATEILARSAPRDDQLLDDLSALIDDDDVRVQRKSIETIRSLGPAGREALSKIIEKLQSTDGGVRLAALEFVGSHGQSAAEAVDALGELLSDPTAEIKVMAARTLGKLGKAAQPVFSVLTPLLDAEQASVREAAASTLVSLELDVDLIRPHLAKALRDKTPEVRRATMRAIGQLGPDAALFLPDIILLAEKKENRETVERSLRRFERRDTDARSVPELMELLSHEAEDVRALAARFLGRAGSSAKDALAALERLREDPSEKVRKEAETACKRINGENVPAEPEAGG
jgi:HEAT repeat protein